MRISFKKGFWTVKEISRIGSSKINMVYSSVSFTFRIHPRISLRSILGYIFLKIQVKVQRKQRQFFSSSYGPDSKLCHGKFMAKVLSRHDDHKNCLLLACSSSSTSFWLVSLFVPCYATKFSMNSKLWLWAVHAIIKWSKWVQVVSTLKCEKNGNQIK